MSTTDAFCPNGYQLINHQDTYSFSKLVIDYLQDDTFLRSFYAHRPNIAGVQAAILQKEQQEINREVLVDILRAQYQQWENIEAVNVNIDKLLLSNTYTVCTAHQPNMMTGHLYFFYKIIHAIKLAQYLESQISNKNFVPVFYIGSEDNDLEELDHFYFRGKTYRWNTDQTGAVGSMSAAGVDKLIEALLPFLGPTGPNKEKLVRIITEAYDQQHTIAQAVTYIIHHLLGKYGVVVLDANDRRLKLQYKSVIESDILTRKPSSIVQSTNARLQERYKTQAFVRPINSFYMLDGLRARIEQEAEGYRIVGTDLFFDAEAMQAEIHNYPERFSPNVILRGLYQETILPNVAFIGGGSEVAYWMQLKDLFEQYQVPFPVIVLRQSFLFINEATISAIKKVGKPLSFIFQNVEDVITNHAQANLDKQVIQNAQQQIQQVVERLKVQSANIDPSLLYSAEAVQTKMLNQLHILGKKMLRAEKKKNSELTNRLHAIHSHLFPEGVMQERKLNFMEYYLSYGDEYFEMLLANTQVFGDRFVIIFENK